MSNDPASENSTAAAIAYLIPMELPRRPGLLTALGIGDFVVAAISIVANLAAILVCVLIYRLTLPGPTPVAMVAALPLAPSTPVTPYHGDYLPANGLPKELRVAAIEAAVKSRRLNRDRQAMLDRLLAECGKQIFGNKSTGEITASVAQSTAGWHKPGERDPIVFDFSIGKIEINNSDASFTPGDGSPATSIKGNFVTVAGKAQYCAIAIDETIDAEQRRLDGAMNALQAGALAELYRPSGGGLPISSPLLTPNIHEIGKFTGVPGCRTIGTPFGWILSTGAVVSSPTPSLDPITGLPRVPVPPPAPVSTRRLLTLDHSLIFASVAEYLLSAALAILLVVAGVRTFSNSGDAPRLHGAYAIIKIALAFANFILGMLTMEQLADGGFLPGMSWGSLVFALGVQIAFPVAIAIVFLQESVKHFYRRSGIDGQIVPASWLKSAARLSPDSWGRLPSLIALVLGVAILLADYYLWSHGVTASMNEAELFYPSLLGGIVLLVGGCLGAFRKVSVPVMLLAGAVLFIPSFARAADDARSTKQLIDEAFAANPRIRYRMFDPVIPRNDAFLPLLQVATHSDSPANRKVAKDILGDWLRRHPRPDSPEAQKAIKEAISQWLTEIHSAPLYADTGDSFLLETLADTPTLIPLVEPWLHEPGDSPSKAIMLISTAKPDNQQKWDMLVWGVDNPRTRQLAEQTLRLYRAADRQQRLEDMAKNDQVPESRAIAIHELNFSPGNRVNRASDTALADRLDDPNDNVRRSAATMLCRSNRGGEKKVAALLHSPSLSKRQTAADALAITSDLPAVLIAITPPLRDRDPAVRAAAAVAWQKPRWKYPDKVPADDLLNLLEDPDPQVRFQGAWAVNRCERGARMLGPYSYPLMRAILFEGLQNHLKEGVLTERSAPSIQKTVDDSVPSYVDADPKTGLAIQAPTPARAGAPVPMLLLPTLARCLGVIAYAAFIAVIAGLLAKARLTALMRKPA